MKKLLALLVLALFGFYVAWPAWSGYRLATALQTGDADLLAAKIDFDSVRTGLRPMVEAEVGKRLDEQLRSAGPLAGALGGDLRKQMVTRVAETAVAQLVTPANLIRIAREGGNVAGTVEKIVMEQIGKVSLPGLPSLPGGGGSGGGLPGGLGNVLGGAIGGGGALGGLGGLPGLGAGQPKAPAPAPAPVPAPTASKPADSKPGYGLANIKRFGFAGPLGLAVSLAQDPAAAKPDVTAVMRFTGFDWKLAEVVPHL
jgi:hypothetical protein